MATTKIVLVDDEVSSRKIIAHIVESNGFTAIQCSNGLLALDVLRDNLDTALVITDMEMPGGMSGRDLIVALRGNADLQRIPIIIVSGVVRLSDIHDLLECGASRFVPKPINREELSSYIQTLTQEATRTRQKT
jgi:CheY-like chemotaxis protein